jgi:quinolinate synthase
MDLRNDILALAGEKNALILAHNYQNPEIQDIAHHTGDSLELARIAAATDARIIVFCGVHFMAESAAILAPEKKVLLPDPSAGCPMADMAGAADVAALKKKHPGARVVSYINTTAAVKAVSDVICTSSNAVTVVDRAGADEIIFVPDKNLASYVQRSSRKKIIPWQGFCPTHERFTAHELLAVKKRHPQAFVMVHPECRPEVVDLADGVFSTGAMASFVAKTDRSSIIVGTEVGMIHKLRSIAPHIEYIPASPGLICPNMKKITLEKLHSCLVAEKPAVIVDSTTAARARKALERMLELS